MRKGGKRQRPLGLRAEIRNPWEIEDLQEELARLSRQVTKTGTELDEAINQIKVADKNKGLYSDRKAKSSPVKLPTFSGNQSEDFLEFLYATLPQPHYPH